MKRAAVGAFFCSMLAIGVTYLVTLVGGQVPDWGAWIVAIATSLAMVATMALGAARPTGSWGGVRRLMLPFALVFVILAGGFTLALLLPAEGEPLWLGIPRRAAIVIYGIGLLPILILPVAYALTFDELTLSDEDLKRIRDLRRENSISPSPEDE